MPTYKYRREDGSTFEIRQKITADPLEECPDTGQKVERVITGGLGFQLKGGGWYADGYADAGGGSAPSGDESKKSPEKSSGGAGSASNGSDAGSSSTEKKAKKSDAA